MTNRLKVGYNSSVKSIVDWRKNMPSCIYKIENKVNGKVYIGQTNDWEKRYRHYRSCPFNTRAHEYNRPIDSAIRKYGLENFDFSIIEIFNDADTQEHIDIREIYWIDFFNSTVSNGGGYNIALGGTGRGTKHCRKNYEERLGMSSKFSQDEIIDIQRLLIDGCDYERIMSKYDISLTHLSNINNGSNYYNPEFSYPLKKDFNTSRRFSEKEIADIKQHIKNGEKYADICAMFNIASPGFLSGINTGKYFHDKNETYPLFDKGSRYRQNANTWVKEVKKALLTTDFSLQKIADSLNLKKSTVKNIERGLSYKEPKFKYPLRQNGEYNLSQL